MKITLHLLQALVKDIDDHKPQLNSVVNAHLPLTQTAEDHVQEVKQDIAHVNQRWEKLVLSIEERWSRYTELKERVSHIRETIQPVEEFVTFAEMTMDNQEPFGLDQDRANQQLAELDVSS